MVFQTLCNAFLFKRASRSHAKTGFSQIAVLLTWEFTFGQLWLPISRHPFGRSQAYFWLTFRWSRDHSWKSFGDLWAPLGCPGRPRASLLGGFGSPGLSLGFLWCFFAYTGLQGGSLSSTLHILLFFLVMCMFFTILPYVFSPWSVVKAARQARPKTTPNARSVVEVCFACSFHIWALLGPFGTVLGFGLTRSQQRFSFKRASRSHAKPGLLRT